MPGFIPFRKIDVWLQGFRSIWVSTVRPDGRPHAVPVWYWWDGKNIYFSTWKGTQKFKNLARQPYVVIHAGDGDDAIILEGTAEVVRDAQELERANTSYMAKYVDPNSGAQATLSNENDSVVYRVRIQHIMAWEYGNIANRTDWRFDE